MIEKIKRFFYTLMKNEDSKDSFFNPLSPTDNAEGCDIYIESLEWALENKDRIKNIAISGPYGSGKSSTIQTFIKKTKSHNSNLRKLLCPKNRFFNISLATFKDLHNIDTENSNKKSIADSELQRLIELSIVQQLFFHEKDSVIPDSRFKKIKRQRKRKLVIYTISIIFFVISLLFLLNPEFLQKFSLFSISNINPKLLQITASTITLIGLFLLIYKLSRSLISLTIRKLNINNAEIEIEDNISKSILNNHLDEIIYFFEATKYNVVIIEDLDRFEQTEVFTKLREINLLINNSKKVKRSIVFIYAIKDDMFQDKDRTKFFDFIIPIIPVVNFSNSGDKLREIVKDNEYKIDDELLDNLSMFIDDMRLLYNIMNEFYIYSRKIADNVDINKLLAIIIYKNIYPNDFTKLNMNEGDLYKTINNKTEYVKSLISRLDQNILELKSEIKLIENQKINDLNELRIIYLAKIVENISVGNKSFSSFNVNDKQIRISEFTEDEYFFRVKNNALGYWFFNPYYGRYIASSFTFDFTDIEKEVNPKLSYDDREKLLIDKKSTNKLKKEIEQINQQKNKVQKSKLKDILSNKQIEIESDSSKKNDLINILLRYGYIDEDYLDYMSIFHEGALTKIDHQFLINIKTEKSTDFDFKLIKTEELLKRINKYEFEKEYILNYNLVDAILISSEDFTKKEFLFNQLSSENEITTNFINEFLDRTQNIELFIFELCKYWTNIWSYISNEHSFTEELIDKYFTLIVQYAAIDDVIEIFEGDVEFLNQYSSFLNIPTSEERIKGIIKGLKLKFAKIELDSPLELLDFVFKNNHYAINVEMLRFSATFKKEIKSGLFETKNYSFILSTKNQSLINYIESNIQEYIESVYLKLKNNTNEEIDSLSKLLNNEKLDKEQKTQIILHSKIIIEDISIIDNQETVNLLIDNLMMAATWENITEIFEMSESLINKELTAFLNQPEIVSKLSEMKMTTAKNEDGVLLYMKLCKAIIHNENINLHSFDLLVRSIPWCYEEFESEKLTKEKIDILIENRIVNPTISSFDFLSENYKGSNVLLLEKHIEKFKDKIKAISIDSDDLVLILKSKVINENSKFEFVNNLEDADIMTNLDSAKIIIRYLVDSKTYDVRDSLKLLLLNSEDLEAIDRIKLFNNNIELISMDKMDSFIISLGGKYEKISDKNRRADIEDTPINRLFLINLEKLQYISSFSVVKKGLRVFHKML